MEMVLFITALSVLYTLVKIQGGATIRRSINNFNTGIMTLYYTLDYIKPSAETSIDFLLKLHKYFESEISDGSILNLDVKLIDSKRVKVSYDTENTFNKKQYNISFDIVNKESHS